MRALAFGALASLVLVTPKALPAASTAVMIAEADVYVFEGFSDRNLKHILLLQAGTGRGHQEGELRTYLRFDLSSIPDSTLFRTTLVDRATLSLLGQSLGLAGLKDRFIVSVARCPDDDWKEDKMTWDTRVCKKLGQTDDMVIIDGGQLPQIYRWDVSRSVAVATQEQRNKITFVVVAFKLEIPEGAREIVPGEPFGPAKSVGFVRFWSREHAALSASAAPTLTVGFSQMDTRLVQFGTSVLAILSALSLVLGLWGTLKRLWSKRSGRSERNVQREGPED